MAKGSKPRATAKEKADGRAARSNAPSVEEFDSFFERLHEINDRLDEDSATHRADMNTVYEEGAKELDMTKEAFIAAFKEDRKAQKQAKKFAKADSRTRDSLLKLAQAYGEESPLGAWAARMADAAGKAPAKTEDTDKNDE